MYKKKTKFLKEINYQLISPIFIGKRDSYIYYKTVKKNKKKNI